MAERFRGVLRASIRMALAARSPMTAREIADYVTHLNPQRPFSSAEVSTTLRSDTDLFVIESRRFFGLGTPRWKLLPSATVINRSVAEPQPAGPSGPIRPAPAVPPTPPPRPPISSTPVASLELIDDSVATQPASPAVTAERVALERERKARQARRGRVPPPRPGKPNYRDVIDSKHPISRLSDETLNRLASDVHADSD